MFESEFGWLVLLALSMFMGSFLAGSVPLAFSLSEEKMTLFSSFGAGLLVGTALIIILPEGVSTLYGHGTEQCASPSEHEEFRTEAYMGAALAFGFVAMFIVDHFGPSHQHRHITVGSIGQDYEQPPKKFSSAFLGLLVHAAADGIALGAAAVGKNKHLEMVIFIAIMLHKAPGAFGLATYLLHEGLTRNGVRYHLAIFSTAAPTFSILTYLALQGVTFNTPQHIWTGLVLLFSAGSFLYVATIHILPEIADDSHHSHQTNEKKLTHLQFMFIVAGLFTPMLLTTEHSHAH